MILALVAVSSLFSLAAAQTNLCSTYGGLCSYNKCSRYYVSNTGYQLCPSAFQRCCISEVCMTRFGGNCQNSANTCNGAKYTHYGTEALCERSTDVCCIESSAPTATTPPTKPVLPAQKDECADFGGKCQVQTTPCVGGSYYLLGSNSEVLCNNWYAKNERCCIPNNKAAATSAPVTQKPATTDSNKCGIQKVQLLDKRIIGGKSAEKGEWPWQVSIIKSASYFGSSFSHTCGGTLIAPQWVVSAAHCFTDVTSHYSIRVRIGEHSFYVDEGTENDAQVVDIVRHPYYDHQRNQNDIALIKLSKPVNLNSQYIGTACLPTAADMPAFYKTDECYTTGWGNTRGTSDDNNILQEVQSSLVSQNTCYYTWGYKIDNTKVCFGNGRKGACVGDSGGPLVCKKDGLFHLVGVVSYGSKSCTDYSVPTVFTSVAAYNQWIQSVISK